MLSSINSDKSRDSPQALLRIHSAPTVPESEAAKQNIAILRGLKRRAMIEAAETCSKKIKHFLSKYCSSECGEILVPILIDIIVIFGSFQSTRSIFITVYLHC